MLSQANAFSLPFKDKSFHMCITSPPYYSLRKYAGEQKFIFGAESGCAHEWGTDIKFLTDDKPTGKQATNLGTIDRRINQTNSNFCQLCGAWYGAYGLEPTLEMYIQHTVEWCREVWRVLRDDGTFWLNIGDSYAGSGGAGGDYNKGGLREGQPKYPGTGKQSFRRDKATVVSVGYGGGTNLKPKDLMMVPARVALALQADGWLVRSDIIWHKPNVMPENVADRPTKSHEYIFLLAKSKKYFYDNEAIREGYAPATIAREDGSAVTTSNPDRQVSFKRTISHSGRNKRTVWKIATAPYKGAHFATFPPALIEPCIKAGTSEKGVCPECGNQWERVVEHIAGTHNPQASKYQRKASQGVVGGGLHTTTIGGVPGKNITLGWKPTCDHGLEPVPPKVLDPFMGSGTTGLVSRNLGRTGIGADLSLEYLGLARKRLSLDTLNAWKHGKAKETEGVDYGELPMFEAMPSEEEINEMAKKEFEAKYGDE